MVSGRTYFYERVEEMKKDFQIYLKFYKNTRSHQGRIMYARRPII